MESPRPVPSLTSDLLEEIFLRIGSPADLARASAACVAFHRLIADPTFLRRYRSLHPPLLLGLLRSDCTGFQPAESPHPSAALSLAVARAGAFSFHDYLPRVTGSPWFLCDVRGGRVLFVLRYYPGRCREGHRFFPEIAVYDPLARRCLLLPPIPDDILASVQVQKQGLRNIFVPLVPSGDEEDGTSFKVIAMADFKEIVVAFIFSSATGHWTAATSASWDALSIPLDDREVLGTSRAYNCFYFKLMNRNIWLKFDMGSMQFSALDVPREHDVTYFSIEEASEGRLGMFSINDGTSLYCYIIRQIGGERFHQLKIDNIIPLPEGYCYYRILRIYEGHIFISGHRLTDREETCFSLEIKTLKIERVCQCQLRFYDVYLYFGFLPSMSQRRI